MSTYYTGKGDKGVSSLLGANEISKDDLIFDLLGDIDELNSYIAVCLPYIKDYRIRKDLDLIQDNLFSISAITANINGKAKLKSVKVPNVSILESEIKRLDKHLPQLRKFVIPGGSNASAHLHFARSISRRVERRFVSLQKKNKLNPNILKYMNRLSSFLFVAALYTNHVNRVGEKNPKYV
jgi:cob(I)alamin adenosyltransferase